MFFRAVFGFFFPFLPARTFYRGGWVHAGKTGYILEINGSPVSRRPIILYVVFFFVFFFFNSLKQTNMVVLARRGGGLGLGYLIPHGFLSEGC